MRRFFTGLIPFVCGVMILSGRSAQGAIISYDALAGLLPHETGWSFASSGTSGDVAVAGGVLTVSAQIGNTRSWELLPVPSTTGDHGVFMESVARIVDETHTQPRRGISLAHIGHADGTSGSAVDLYAWHDRIFARDIFDAEISSYAMDTTDRFHAYRVELLFDQYWIFVDDHLVLSGTVPTVPIPLNAVRGHFGVGGSFSGGTAEWRSAQVGSLADIAGPTVPEPATWLLTVTGLVGLQLLRRRVA